LSMRPLSRKLLLPGLRPGSVEKRAPYLVPRVPTSFSHSKIKE
jgi:hypothetical protein